MSRLIESIRLLDGKFYNLFYHQQRMNHACMMLFDSSDFIDLNKVLEKANPPEKGLYKCRVVYDDHTATVEFVPYTPASIKTLRVVESADISYEYKFRDRAGLDALYSMRGECDDILIVKEDQVTDTYFANIVFKNNEGWCTPESTLLKGTMRQSLLDNKKIREERITKQDIRYFQRFKLINAMLGFEGPEQDIANIILT